MMLTCEAGDLAGGLAAVTRALAPRSTLPVLGTVLLEARGDDVRLTATNLEFALSAPVKATVASDGAVAVPGRLLSEFTGAAAGERLQLELVMPGHRLRLCSPAYTTEIHGIDPDEFPPTPVKDGLNVARLRAGDLAEAILDTLASASTDEARPLLTGIRMVSDADRLTLTSTDGYRVAEQSVHLAEPCALAATVPARAMAEIARLFRHSAREVEISISRHGNQVFFCGPARGPREACFVGWDGEVSSRVIDGTYPNTRRLIPTGWTSRASVDAAELSQRLKAIAPFASASANLVRLDVLPSSLVLSATAAEVGSARTELRAEVSGAETRISFNARYLLDCLSRAHEMVDLELQGPLAPIVVRQPQSADYVYLFMPVRQPR